MQPRQSGTIIRTASNSGVQNDRGMIAYATTKDTAIAMARQIAPDHAQDNVRCNALCPGFVVTRVNTGTERQMGGRQAFDTCITTTIPPRRFAPLQQIADSILALASPRSGFKTGHAIVLAGGESLEIPIANESNHR